MEEREKVLDSLRYGGDDPSISDVAEASRAPFLPALAVLSCQSPLLASSLLPSSHPVAPSVLAYASLDFSPIYRDALHLLRAPPPPLNQEFPPDESFCFLSSDYKDRPTSVIVSLHRQATEFKERFNNLSVEVWQQQHKDAASVWHDKSCLSELNCLLPIAALRCPKLLSPDVFVYGLLPARWGFILLAAVLLNNPLLAGKSLFLLADFLRTYKGSSLSSDCNKLSTQASHFNINAKNHMLNRQGWRGPIVMHSVKQAVLTFLQLGNLSSSLARLCRDTLVIHRVCPSVALYLTAECIGDEVDFLSKVIFSNAKTSEWMLKFFEGSQNDEFANLVDLSEYLDVPEELFLETGIKRDACNHLQGIIFHIRKALLADAQTTKEKFGWSGQLHGHLRLYCMLIWAADFQPFPEELQFWLNSLIAAEGSLSKQTLQLGVAFFCLVPRLSATALIKSLLHKCIAVLLKWNVPIEARYATDVEEQAIWFAVQLLLKQFPEIARVVREAMGTQAKIQDSQIKELHDAAQAAGVISEPSMLLRAIAGLRLRGPLSSKMRRGKYMLECLDQLLRSGHFSRNGIDVSEAIAHLISVSTTPIHGLLVQAIQAYTEAPAAIVYGTAGSQTFRMPPLRHSFLQDLLLKTSSSNVKLQMDGMDDNGAEAREVLASYYILCRERFLRGKGLGSSQSSILLSFGPLDSKENWTALLLKIRFHELFQYMEERWLDFVDVLPQWLSLAASLFPERLPISDLLASLNKSFALPSVLDNGRASNGTLDNDWCASVNTESPSAVSEASKSGLFLQQHQRMGNKQVPGTLELLDVANARRAMEVALLNPMPSIQLLSVLDLMSAEERSRKELLDYQVLIIKELVPKLLDPSCSQSLQERFCTWFKSLQPLLSRALLPALLESILDTSLEQESDSKAGLMMRVQLKAMVSELRMTAIGAHNSLVQQPLTLLACKLRVYQTPLLFIILDLLQEFRTINRRTCLEIVLKGTKGEEDIKQEEILSALLAQDSALCQILLEACLPHGDNIKNASLLKASEIIFGFLAPLLETDHELLKLVHFQGYDLQLVPMMVKGVPAMVQCLKIVPELLQQQEPSKQIFAITLIAHVACSYVDLQESLMAVEKVLAHVLFIQKSSQVSASFMQEIMEALVQCACAFPAVAADVRNILQRCLKLSRPLKRGYMPRDPVLQDATRSALKRIRQKAG